MAIIGPAARALASLCDRSALLSGLLRHSRFPFRCRIAAEIRRVPGPRERMARSHGARYRLDLQDSLQRAIYFRCYESAALRRSLRLPPSGGVCLDVGANVGFFALPLALRVGSGGTVHAFEPDARVAARLRANAELNGLQGVLHVHEAAVTDRDGRVTLYQGSEANSGWGSLAEFRDIAVSRAEVEAVTLDSFLARTGTTRVDFLKVDVEAGELELLDGAREALRAGVFRHVLIEFNGPRMSERGRTFDEFLSRFTTSGYRVAAHDAPLVERMRRRAIRPESCLVNLLFQRGDGTS